MYARSENMFQEVSDNEKNDKITASIVGFRAEPLQVKSEDVLSFAPQSVALDRNFRYVRYVLFL